MSACRIIIESAPQSGRRNMAVDEVLLESALNRQICTLRWYRWSEATLSLGYFQKPNDPAISDRLRALPMVRRLSGGGAIVHHHEWTYSCALPKSHPLAQSPGDVYAAMHTAIIAVLRQHRVEAHLRGAGKLGDNGTQGDRPFEREGLSPAENQSPTFLCFARGDANDVLLAGHKIIGSAQRRRRGAILQHGSMMWRASEHAPHLPGIGDLAKTPADDGQLVRELAAAMGTLLGDEFEHVPLGSDEIDRAGLIESERDCDLQR